MEGWIKGELSKNSTEKYQNITEKGVNKFNFFG